ncbi:MAG: DinB family protein [Saprospiraceae bacterium]|nr:DinB family protein [Saprospiraceae bacterium]MCB9326550.1 DinB family protein [Lewinellaceae bacterium]
MYHSEVIAQLKRNKAIFEHQFKGLTNLQYSWKPAPEKWCLLEILCHLHDEEVEDFRARVKHVLETPEAPMPPIDPEGWVTARKYAEADFEERLDAFLTERQNSIDWLESLEDPKWTNVYHHPALGAMSAQKFLSNWLTHDLLHFRQIGNVKFFYLQYITGEDLSYAGNW